MTTIIQDNFSNGASVALDMDKDAGELFLFHFQAEGKGVITRKYPLDSYHMTVAIEAYNAACDIEVANIAA